MLPLRLFLGALFCFAGYAKFSYPGFFDEGSRNGFQSATRAASEGTPLSFLMDPLVDNPSVFGHITAVSEIAIGLGLLVGLLTRMAALAGMILTTSILLSIDWNGVKEYTGTSGWFTAVDLAIAAALSIFLLGGSGPLALDNLFIRARERQRARDEAEPSFRDSDIDDSRRRLQGEPAYGAAAATAQLPVAGGYRDADRDNPDQPGRSRFDRPEDRDTTSLSPRGPWRGGPASGGSRRGRLPLRQAGRGVPRRPRARDQLTVDRGPRGLRTSPPRTSPPRTSRRAATPSRRAGPTASLRHADRARRVT